MSWIETVCAQGIRRPGSAAHRPRRRDPQDRRVQLAVPHRLRLLSRRGGGTKAGGPSAGHDTHTKPGRAFLATLSHELRSPMNAMLGWIRVLKAGGVRDDNLIGRAVETLERNVRIQAQIVNDLLDVSRILSGKLQVERERVALAPVVTCCVQSLRPSAGGKHIGLRLDVRGDELEVLGDEARLQQVFANLLGNAIKFTEAAGRITVTVERKRAPASVVGEETGQGLAPDVLPHIFEPFRQAESGSTRSHGGLGLGLSIVKKIVSLHGGDIEAESAGVGRGARFRVVLPLVDVQQKTAFRPPTAPTTNDGTPRAV